MNDKDPIPYMTFYKRQHTSDCYTVEVNVNDEDATIMKIIDSFRSFLIASGFSENMVDENLGDV